MRYKFRENPDWRLAGERGGLLGSSGSLASTGLAYRACSCTYTPTHCATLGLVGMLRVQTVCRNTQHTPLETYIPDTYRRARKTVELPIIFDKHLKASMVMTYVMIPWPMSVARSVEGQLHITCRICLPNQCNVNGWLSDSMSVVTEHHHIILTRTVYQTSRANPAH